MNNNKFEKKNNMFSLIISLFSLFATCLLLIFVVLAWYTKNTEVEANGIIGSTSAENGLLLISSRTYMLDGETIIKENDELNGLLVGDTVYFELQVKYNEEITESTTRNVTISANNIGGGDFFTKLKDDAVEGTTGTEIREIITYGGKQFNMCDCFTVQLLNISITNTAVTNTSDFNSMFTDSNKITSPSANVADEFIGAKYLERETTTNTFVSRHKMATYTGWKPSEGEYISFKFAITFTTSKTISGTGAEEGTDKTISELVPINELSRKIISFNQILVF